MSGKGTVGTLLKDAARRLEAAGIPSPLWEVRFLLSDITGLTTATLVADPDRLVPEAERFRDWVAAREAGKPSSRITGYRHFWGHEFGVSAATLDPRAESEALVAAVLETTPTDRPLTLLDLGTGTGCLPISLLSERRHWTATGLDSSAEALVTAAGNAKRLDVDDRIRFVQGNWTDGIADGSFDVVISNPPYIRRKDLAALEPVVRNYDPMSALDGGPDGLGAYRIICADAPRVLRPGGTLALEIGWDQAGQVCDLVRSAGLTAVSVRQDLGRRDRVIDAKRPKPA